MSVTFKGVDSGRAWNGGDGNVLPEYLPFSRTLLFATSAGLSVPVKRKRINAEMFGQRGEKLWEIKDHRRKPSADNRRRAAADEANNWPPTNRREVATRGWSLESPPPPLRLIQGKNRESIVCIGVAMRSAHRQLVQTNNVRIIQKAGRRYNAVSGGRAVVLSKTQLFYHFTILSFCIT